MSIQNNEVYSNKGHGIMLHRSSDDGIIRNNTVTDSGSACIALFESFGTVIGCIECALLARAFYSLACFGARVFFVWYLHNKNPPGWSGGFSYHNRKMIRSSCAPSPSNKTALQTVGLGRWEALKYLLPPSTPHPRFLICRTLFDYMKWLYASYYVVM